jgi:hypothetical protein
VNAPCVVCAGRVRGGGGFLFFVVCGTCISRIRPYGM